MHLIETFFHERHLNLVCDMQVTMDHTDSRTGADAPPSSNTNWTINVSDVRNYNKNPSLSAYKNCFIFMNCYKWELVSYCLWFPISRLNFAPHRNEDRICYVKILSMRKLIIAKCFGYYPILQLRNTKWFSSFKSLEKFLCVITFFPCLVIVLNDCCFTTRNR